MTWVRKSALVRYPARHMFELVADIEAYAEFLPWCSDSKILRKLNENQIEAELKIAKGGFRKAFATRNTAVDQQRIDMTLLNGPFKKLKGSWFFIPLREDASKIALELEFELDTALAALAFGAVFNQICNTMVGSFTQRAKDVYGQ